MSKVLSWFAALVALFALSMPGHGRAEAGDPLPISAEDGVSGNSGALVTIVLFSDLECPYCARLDDTLAGIRGQYDERDLRLVFKHYPLAFHEGAHEKAQAAQAVLALFGQQKLAAYIDAAFAAPKEDWRDYARGLKLDPRAIERVIAGGKPKKKVDADIALARSVGVRGTPAMFINGVRLVGSRPEADITKLIDEQLAAAKTLVAGGTPAAKASAMLTRKNYTPAAPNPPSSRKPTPDYTTDNTVWKVPVGASPQLGAADALVTLVVFSDFQCPFCERDRHTLDDLRKKYGRDLRIVFKNNPLPFHQRAEPAAQLAMEAFKRLGHPGFWKAHDLLFDNTKNLEDGDLEKHAAALGLSPPLTMTAVRGHKHKRAIEDDQKLAAEVEASGTPHHFINGRKLPGAQKIETFATIIDQELIKAKKLRAQGVPAASLYAHIIKSGKVAPPPEKP